jgi:long-chain fatty acid transport protein
MGKCCARLLAVVVVLFTSVSTVAAQGLISPGSGAMHRSMAGVSTAVGVDALGAVYWNPAAISGLPQSEVVIGSEMILPDTHLGSTVPAGAFGPLGPAVTMSGVTRSDSGLVPTTGVGVVYHPEDSQLSFGLGIVTLAAGGVNFPGDVNNPVLAPSGPLNQFILGPQVASAAILGLIPTASLQVTDRLAFGFSPMIDVAVVSFDPAFFGPTSQARLIDPRQFPTGSHTRPFWGGGFRAGATYRITDRLVAGFSYTSPQWFETWEFNARDANGNPITFETPFSLPQIFSLGLAYDGIDRLLLAADVRWFDYRTTKLLGQPVVEGGANWDSIWAVALGSRYQVSDRLSVQVGYLFNQNPISPNLALFNTQLPALTKHTISAGTHFQMNDSIGLSLAYVHGFKNTISGAVFPLTGTSTTLDTEYDSIVLGLHIKFGGPRCKDVVVSQAAPSSSVMAAETTSSAAALPGPR